MVSVCSPNLPILLKRSITLQQAVVASTFRSALRSFFYRPPTRLSSAFSELGFLSAQITWCDGISSICFNIGKVEHNPDLTINWLYCWPLFLLIFTVLLEKREIFIISKGFHIGTRSSLLRWRLAFLTHLHIWVVYLCSFLAHLASSRLCKACWDFWVIKIEVDGIMNANYGFMSCWPSLGCLKAYMPSVSF